MTYSWSILSGDAVIDGASNTQTVQIDFGNVATEIQLITSGTDCCMDTCSITPTLLRYDFGDLPDSGNGVGSGNYETEAANGGPAHLIVAGLSIGSTLDNEIDGQPNATATGDDADEDGYNFPTNMAIVAGRIINLPLDIVNTTGMPAHLEAWIDWNGNGEFDIGEMVADFTDDGAGDFGQTYFTVNIPLNAIQGQDIGVRFRLSQTDNMTPYGTVNAGEVEDYLIKVTCPSGDCLPIIATPKRGPN